MARLVFTFTPTPSIVGVIYTTEKRRHAIGTSIHPRSHSSSGAPTTGRSARRQGSGNGDGQVGLQVHNQTFDRRHDICQRNAATQSVQLCCKINSSMNCGGPTQIPGLTISWSKSHDEFIYELSRFGGPPAGKSEARYQQAQYKLKTPIDFWAISASIPMCV
jgi:hypothetical protein